MKERPDHDHAATLRLDYTEVVSPSMNADDKARRPFGIPIAWWVATGCALGLALGFSTVAATVFGQFVPALSSAFGWTRAQTTLAMAFSNIPLLVMAPAFGLLVDRLGAWRTLCFSQLAVPLILISLATLNGSLTQLYISFFLLAVLGAGTLPAAYTRVILTWFNHRRGMGFGIALSGVGLAALVLPPITQALIVTFGWRAAVVLIGLLILIAGMINVMTLLRLKPQSTAEIDGGYHPPQGAAIISEKSGVHWRQALHDYRYWVIALAYIPLGVASMGFLVNLPAILIDQKFSLAGAATMTIILGATLILARIVTGWFLDRVSTSLVMTVIFLAPAIGFFLLAIAQSPLLTAFGIFLIAFGIGAEFDVMAFLLSRLFGPISYGALYGGVYAAYNIGVAIGPVYMAHQFDVTGSYSFTLNLFGALFIIAAIALPPVARRIRPAG